MITNKTVKTVINGDEENDSPYITTRSLLNKMANKYDVEVSKLVVGMQFDEMVVQLYDEGDYPVWRTLEIITINK